MRKIFGIVVLVVIAIGFIRIIFPASYSRYVHGTSWDYSEEHDKMFPELGLFKLFTNDEINGGYIEISCDTRTKGQKSFKLEWSNSDIEKSYPTTLIIVLDSDPPITKKFGSDGYGVIDQRLKYTSVALLTPNLSLGNPHIYFEGKDAYQFLDLLKGKTIFAIKKDAVFNEFNLTGLDNDLAKLSAHCPREVEKKAKKGTGTN